jgi:hypothetical protein
LQLTLSFQIAEIDSNAKKKFLEGSLARIYRPNYCGTKKLVTLLEK